MKTIKFFTTAFLGFLILSVVGCKKNCLASCETDKKCDTIASFQEPLFKKLIPAYDEYQYVRYYDAINKNFPEMEKSFSIDYKNFKDFISNQNFKYAKFFYLQNNSNEKINIGLILSDNDLVDIKNDSIVLNRNDKNFILENENFRSINENDFKTKIENFRKNVASKIWTNDKSKITLCTMYKKEDLTNYFSDMEKSTDSSQNKLNFVMIYFGKVYKSILSDELVVRDETKYGRISFSVHIDDMQTKINPSGGYDAGDLKP